MCLIFHDYKILHVNRFDKIWGVVKKCKSCGFVKRTSKYWNEYSYEMIRKMNKYIINTNVVLAYPYHRAGYINDTSQI